jgi:hypothetical protein
LFDFAYCQPTSLSSGGRPKLPNSAWDRTGLGHLTKYVIQAIANDEMGWQLGGL